MNTLQRFEFPLLQSKRDANFECWAAVMPNGCVVCKLQELAEFLNYNNEESALEYVPCEWRITWKRLKPKIRHDPTTAETNGWQPETLFVLEPGIYALLARCFKPLDREQMKFVCEMILPAIRKTGYYEIGNMTCVETLRTELRQARAEKQMILADYQAALTDHKNALMAMEVRVREMKHVYEQRIAEYERRKLSELKRFEGDVHMLITE
ncbi:BRO [Orgyia pseudotsugata single capsid nuclopolyhedrovirus]|nr:BRO [Orgyia pseudotsugata single capsid nuclopolyhedrovirus]